MFNEYIEIVSKAIFYKGFEVRNGERLMTEEELIESLKDFFEFPRKDRYSPIISVNVRELKLRPQRGCDQGTYKFEAYPRYWRRKIYKIMGCGEKSILGKRIARREMLYAFCEKKESAKAVMEELASKGYRLANMEEMVSFYRKAVFRGISSPARYLFGEGGYIVKASLACGALLKKQESQPEFYNGAEIAAVVE